MASFLSTQRVADLAGVHKDTLLRWLREQSVAEPARDRRGWRLFTEREAEMVVQFANGNLVPQEVSLDDPSLRRLAGIQWDFNAAKTSYLTHGIHPYPAKFIPQIPNALIQELSSVGETIGDIFCGSGTTLLEALQLKRNAVGIDANPLAALISSVKTRPLNLDQLSIVERHKASCDALVVEAGTAGGDMFYGGRPFVSEGRRPDPRTCEFWFLPHVVEELAEIARRVELLEDDVARNFCKVALSAIIVTVSKQDSDTRYVRRDKSVSPGDTVRRYVGQLSSSLTAARELTDLLEDRFHCDVHQHNILETPDTEPLDLVVTSPPYPNAFSYHLYHRTRMLWLGYDPEQFKRVEIGSHRKYSAKGRDRATQETFKREFVNIFQWLRGRLRDGRYACFVIGDSTLAGERIDNATLIASAGQAAGFREVSRISRTIQSTRKAFNPIIGKIKSENILILRKD